jgi:hypothetical protein
MPVTGDVAVKKAPRGKPPGRFLLFRMSGQGRGRTADLPLFRRTLVPTELPDLGACGASAPTAAVLTGFEPATSTLTGWRALQLLYRTMFYEGFRPRSQEHITDAGVVAAPPNTLLEKTSLVPPTGFEPVSPP